MATKKGSRKRKRSDAPSAAWNAPMVRSLRQHLGFSQEELAEEMGTRQQTISEWETGRYRPRGASARLLTIVAERAEFRYGEMDAREATKRSDEQERDAKRDGLAS